MNKQDMEKELEELYQKAHVSSETDYLYLKQMAESILNKYTKDIVLESVNYTSTLRFEDDVEIHVFHIAFSMTDKNGERVFGTTTNIDFYSNRTFRIKHSNITIETGETIELDMLLHTILIYKNINKIMDMIDWEMCKANQKESMELWKLIHQKKDIVLNWEKE